MRITLIFLAVALLAASVPLRAEEPAPNTPDALADFDQSFVRFKRDVWNVQRLTSMFGRDFRGRTLSDDLRDFVLVRSTETELQKQRTLAEKQLRAHRPTADSSLALLNKMMADENTRLDEIFAHRMLHRQVARQRDLWREYADRSPNYKTPAYIEKLEQDAVARLNAAEFTEVTLRLYPALQRAYTAERAELAKTLRVNATPIYYARLTPCGDVAKSTSGKSVPSLVSKIPPEYPAASRRSGEEGNVMVNVLVSATGCATSFAIASTSGWPALDDAALDWMEETRFNPGERDGKAADVYVTVPVNFKLDE